MECGANDLISAMLADAPAVVTAGADRTAGAA